MEVDDSRTTAGNVSMLETRLLCSKSEAVEVKMFSGGGIVSVWKSGDLVADGVNFRVVVDEGSATLLVKVRVTVMNLKHRFIRECPHTFMVKKFEFTYFLDITFIL